MKTDKQSFDCPHCGTNIDHVIVHSRCHQTGTIVDTGQGPYVNEYSSTDVDESDWIECPTCGEDLTHVVGEGTPLIPNIVTTDLIYQLLKENGEIEEIESVGPVHAHTARRLLGFQGQVELYLTEDEEAAAYWHLLNYNEMNPNPHFPSLKGPLLKGRMVDAIFVGINYRL
ncbi:MAG: hypothetical protein V1799_07615 [bacterium]